MKLARTAATVGFLCAAAQAGAVSIELVNVAPHVSHVVAIAHAGDGSGRLFFAQQFGRIRVHAGGATLPTPFLDITGIVNSTGPEEGLLGLAFDPAYETNGFFFVYYTNSAGDNVIARYHASPASNVADPASGVVVLVLAHPLTDRHNGGQLQFGPDGFLYVGTGDGGPPGDWFENAQNLGSLLGKILRIDVRSLPYTIPPGNPFVGVPGARREIWAYGLRNPWRFSFDRATGDLFIADVGEHLVEEVNFQPAGSPGGVNYGWDDMEGSRCFEPSTGCLTAGRTLPVIEYQHDGNACGVIGGYRYRGTAVPALVGNYVYADFCNPYVQVSHQFPEYWWRVGQSTTPVFNYSTFGEDEAGELYVAQLIYELKGPVVDGNVYRLAPGGLGVFAGGINVTPEAVGVVDVGAYVEMSHLPITVDYTTASGTAASGADFTPVSGTLTFPPWTFLASVPVPVAPDALDEEDEKFTVRFSNLQGAVMAGDTAQVTIVDDDPPASLVPFLCSAVEGNTGTTPCSARVRLVPESGKTVTVQYLTSPGTAVPGDYQAVSGTVTFAPGVTEGVMEVPIVGDTNVEHDESFQIVFGPTTNVVLPAPSVLGVIVDDDGSVSAGGEVAHGSRVVGDLAVTTDDSYRLPVAPFSSYEIVLDQQSGDALDAGLQLGTFSATAVLATGTAKGTGGALSMTYVNPLGSAPTNRVVRVRAEVCGAACDAQDTYRLSVRETTLRVPRFNQRSGQRSVLVLFNPSTEPLATVAYFWNESGQLLAAAGAALPAHGSSVLDLASLPPLLESAGSITVTHDGAYGALAGKLVSVDPATGAAFESPAEPRPR